MFLNSVLLSTVSSVQIAKPNRLIAKLVINYIFKMRAAKKRNVHNEGRLFKKEWTTKYFYADVGSTAVCQKNVAVLREYNFCRHFDTNHANYHSSLSIQQREITSQRLVAHFRIQQNSKTLFFSRVRFMSQSLKQVSYWFSK